MLAATPELAKKLGRRRAPDPILVIVQAQAATRRGLSFTGYGEGLYLAPALSRDLLQLPPPPQAPDKPKTEKPRPQAPTPGSFALELPGMAPPAPKPWQSKGKKDEPAWKSGTRALRKQRGKGGKGKGEKARGSKRHTRFPSSRLGNPLRAGFYFAGLLYLGNPTLF